MLILWLLLEYLPAVLLSKEMTVYKIQGLPILLLSDFSSNIAVQSKEG